MGLELECPECGEDFELSQDYYCEMSRPGLIENVVCTECGEKIDVELEFEPVATGYRIEYLKCDRCGKEGKNKHGAFRKRKDTIDFPEGDEYVLCSDCFHRSLMERYEKTGELPFA